MEVPALIKEKLLEIFNKIWESKALVREGTFNKVFKFEVKIEPDIFV